MAMTLMYIYSWKKYSSGDVDNNWQYFSSISACPPLEFCSVQANCLKKKKTKNQKNLCSICLIVVQICYSILKQLHFYLIFVLWLTSRLELLFLIRWIDLDVSYEVNVCISVQIEYPTLCLVNFFWFFTKGRTGCC